jgi:hypothetical protein
VRGFRTRVPLEDQVVLDRLLDDAFAPGRSRTVPISAARVRARVAWERPVDGGLRGLALFGRLAETSLAIGMTALLFTATLGGVAPTTETVQPEGGSEYVVRVSAPLDDMRFLRLLRIGRTAPVADDVDPATALRPDPTPDEPDDALPERQGLLR